MEINNTFPKNIPSKHVSDSAIEEIRPVFKADLNSQNRLFGGTLVTWIDVVAGCVARKHSSCNVTTAAIDSLQFKEPVFENNMVVLQGRLTTLKEGEISRMGNQAAQELRRKAGIA